MNERELLDLKDKITKAENKVLKLTGEQEALLKQLKKDWKCMNLKEAEKKLEKFRKEEKKLQKEIEEDTNELVKLLPDE